MLAAFRLIWERVWVRRAGLPPAAGAVRPAWREEMLGRRLASEGRPEEALPHYAAAVALRPDRGPLLLRRGECHHAVGRPDQALGDYLIALACGLGSRRLYSAAMYGVAAALRDQLATAHQVSWGQSLQSPDGETSALPAFPPPVDEGDPWHERTARPRAASRSGAAAIRSGLRRTFLRLTRLCPLLGQVLGRVLPYMPHSGAAARLYLWLAQAKAAAGDYKAAIGCCDRAVARRPFLAWAHAYRRQLLIRLGEGRRGVEDLQRALAGARPASDGAREPLACCHETLGQWLMFEGRPQAALEHFEAVVSLRSGHGPSYLLRGECRYALGRAEQAQDDFLTALASGQGDGLLRSALPALGRVLACEGRIEQGVAYYYAALALPDGREHPPGRRPEGKLDLARLMQAYDALAEDVVNWHGKLDVARLIYRARLDLQQGLAAAEPGDSRGDLVLPDDWVRNIGHMGALDALLKLNQLGWQAWRRVLVLAPPKGVANPHYLTYLDGHLKVVTDPALCESLAPRAATFGFRVAHGLYPPGSDLRYFFEALGLIQQQWEGEGRPPLLTLSDADRRRGRTALEELGMPRGAWFVSLHVRESGFHESDGGTHQSHRNADVRDYLPAIRLIAERGGWVVRLGDPSMTPLPETDHVIDYAHSAAKSDWMDVFLSGECRFFLGLASGPSQVAVSFGAPCLYVNWISNVLPPFSARDLYIPKVFRRRSDGRLLSFGEMYDPNYLYLNSCNWLIPPAGLAPVDNDPSEIRDAVREMLEQLDGRGADAPEDLRRRRQLDEILQGFGHRGCCRMGKAFLSKYSRLLARPDSLGGTAARAAG